jgi:hypothetical protein
MLPAVVLAGVGASRARADDAEWAADRPNCMHRRRFRRLAQKVTVKERRARAYADAVKSVGSDMPQHRIRMPR